MTSGRNKTIRANILLIISFVWVLYFAFFKYEALNQYWVTLTGFAWFGGGFISLIKSKQGNRDGAEN